MIILQLAQGEGELSISHVAKLFFKEAGGGFVLAMSDHTRERLDDFWELIDEFLNAILFMLIGLEILVIPFSLKLVFTGLFAIVITLFARWACVGGAVLAMRPFRPFIPGVVTMMTWGGLRGGISVALALSLPYVPERTTIITITYIIVIFSIVVQGMTLQKLADRQARKVVP